MGNCVFRGLPEGHHQAIKVVTSTGGIMELYSPITAECITNELPGQGIFNSRSRHLLHNEELLVGEIYYLLPLGPQRPRPHPPPVAATRSLSGGAAPYRMSFDNQGVWRRPEAAESSIRSGDGGGIWKVKLVITPEQLTEILSEEATTEALIESVRTVAKCGSGFGSAASSDQWSLASSWKSSEKVA